MCQKTLQRMKTNGLCGSRNTTSTTSVNLHSDQWNVEMRRTHLSLLESRLAKPRICLTDWSLHAPTVTWTLRLCLLVSSPPKRQVSWVKYNHSGRTHLAPACFLQEQSLWLVQASLCLDKPGAFLSLSTVSAVALYETSGNLYAIADINEGVITMYVEKNPFADSCLQLSVALNAQS